MSQQIKMPPDSANYQGAGHSRKSYTKHRYIVAYFLAEGKKKIMDAYLQFLREERAGLYKGYRYPNLIEVRKQGCLYIEIFANVTRELLLAAFRGEEKLTDDEIRRVARYNGIPYSVLACPKVIMLDMGRWRHRKMVAEVNDLYILLKCMAQQGNQKAAEYLHGAEWEYQKLMEAVHDNKLSYIHYLGAKRQLSDYILFATPKPKARGISAKKGGAAWHREGGSIGGKGKGKL